VLIEAATQGSPATLENALLAVADDVSLMDAVIAKNTTESQRLWRLRHSIAEAERQEGKAVKHDISVPIAQLQNFLVRGEALVAELSSRARLLVFGHVGDGNLHYNIALPSELSAEAWNEQGLRLSEAIYALVDELGGSFSAEHGVGRIKKAYLAQYRGGAEIGLMRALKRSLDPGNILNPGKVI
jgi:FAD/FMN-containing dehydrogenase